MALRPQGRLGNAALDLAGMDTLIRLGCFVVANVVVEVAQGAGGWLKCIELSFHQKPDPWLVSYSQYCPLSLASLSGCIQLDHPCRSIATTSTHNGIALGKYMK